jgi:hypothetical protein
VRAGARRAGDLDEGVAELVRFVGEVGGGRIELPRVEGGRIVVPMRARDDERYLLQIEVTRYLLEPPRCSFVDERGEARCSAWPAYDPAGPFRPPDFICTPPTAEFYAAHMDRVYRFGEGSLENAVATIFTALQGDGYAGRCEEEWLDRHPLRRPRRRQR